MTDKYSLIQHARPVRQRIVTGFVPDTFQPSEDRGASRSPTKTCEDGERLGDRLLPQDEAARRLRHHNGCFGWKPNASGVAWRFR